MTSEERHELRYQRRCQRRQAKRLARSIACGSFEEAFSFNLLQKCQLEMLDAALPNEHHLEHRKDPCAVDGWNV